MTGIKIEGIRKSYNGVDNVIDNFNLEIEDGEFLVLLGPSGCGKSTLLRIIAGLEDISAGTIRIDGEIINDKEAKDRNIAMVFQNYALYPHMTIYKNIAIGLMLKKTPAAEIESRVAQVAKKLDIEDLLDRKPRQLSGGQMQRVALARAMIRNPKVFLMDEPLSNLDSKLRVQTRAEIMKLHQSLNVTTIYVTHDQVEAMTMADTIVLMRDGKIQQKGSPEELYNRPENYFVATFIGSPQMNFLPGEIKDKKLRILDQTYRFNYGQDKKVKIGLRPEHIEIRPGDQFLIELIENLGSEKLIYTKCLADPSINLVVRADVDTGIALGEKCNISIKKENFHLFDENTERRIDEEKGSDV